MPRQNAIEPRAESRRRGRQMRLLSICDNLRAMVLECNLDKLQEGVFEVIAKLLHRAEIKLRILTGASHFTLHLLTVYLRHI